MDSIIYLVGLIVVVMLILSVLGSGDQCTWEMHL